MNTETQEQMDFNALLFPGRKVLYVAECAAAIDVTEQHIINAIEAGKLGAINVGNASRKFYRIPAAEWEKYLKQQATA